MTALSSEPGLPAIRKLREDRKRGRFARPTANLLLLSVAGIALTLCVYWVISQRELSASKSALLARHEAVESTLGREWFPLRDRIEQLVVAASGPWRGDAVDNAPSALSVDRSKMIYLRMKQSDSVNSASIRSAAQVSLRDGFLSCFVRRPEKRAADEAWNLRQAYASTRVLQPEWVSEVREAGDSLRLRVFQQQFDKAVRDEIPLAVDIVKGAQLFVLVLDEPGSDPSMDEAALQSVAHPSRVFLFDLAASGAELMRVRRVGYAALLGGAVASADEATAVAMRRQANNCSLGEQARATLPK